MQVINANKRVESLEFSTDGGASWTSTERQYYNYFQKSSGSGTTTVDVKITSIDGDVVIVKDVNISSGESATASGNFGSSG
jgi:expansin